MIENKFNIAIIGAGIVGLAIAERLSRIYKNIIVIDKEQTFGQHVSSRNSEVIHSGFYYPKNSLKSRLCIKGNKMLYQFAEKYHINHRKCGKLVVINSADDEQELYFIKDNAINCGLDDVQILDRIKSQNIEKRVNCYKSLWVPSTGIIDSHGVMSKLEYLARSRDVAIVYQTKLSAIKKIKGYYQLSFDNDDISISSDIVINAAGLWSDKVAHMIGLNNYQLEYFKGDYFKSRSIKNLNCLIYPLPTISTLGIHSVLSLNGDVSFGPNIYSVDKIDYKIDDRFKEEYTNQIKNLINIDNIDLHKDFSGIRPKVKFDGNFNDFIIQNESRSGFDNFINLIGIDSPGLTSSLAIAKYVYDLIR